MDQIDLILHYLGENVYRFLATFIGFLILRTAPFSLSIIVLSRADQEYVSSSLQSKPSFVVSFTLEASANYPQL